MNSLEALKRIRQETAPATYMPDFDKEECCNIIENDLIQSEKDKRFREIVVSKEVVLGMLKTCKTVEQYNAGCKIFGRNQLTEEEFNFLKEMTNNE